MKRIYLLLLLLPAHLHAQEAMSLNDCIRMAWSRNPEIRNSDIAIREAKADYVSAIGSFLPRATVRAEAGSSRGRAIDPNTNSYTTDSFEEGTVGLDMTLSLFEGFARINRVKFRQINKERSRLEQQECYNELAYRVTDAYYKVILEGKLLALAAEQSLLSERYLKQTEQFVTLGLKSVSDLQEVKARRAGDAYRHESRQNSHRLAVLELRQLMNTDQEIALIPTDSIEEETLPASEITQTESLYEQSLTTLPAVRLMTLKQQAARKEQAMAAGQFAPSLFARFQVSSRYAHTLFSAPQLRDNVGNYIGIGVSFPLLDGLERIGRLRKQKLNRYRLQNQEETLKQEIYTDVEKTLLALHAGRAEHRQALQQVAAERQVLRESERKWEEGLLSVFELMEARNRFIAAKAELTRVRLQVEMTRKMEYYYRNGRFIETN
ncbi:MAG: TolC family protein [Bacteroides sp.]|nr:TolC family protein [Bacteroides sp.]